MDKISKISIFSKLTHVSSTFYKILSTTLAVCQRIKAILHFEKKEVSVKRKSPLYGTQSPPHSIRENFLDIGALTLRHSPYSKINCIEGLSIQ